MCATVFPSFFRVKIKSVHRSTDSGHDNPEKIAFRSNLLSTCGFVLYAIINLQTNAVFRRNHVARVLHKNPRRTYVAEE